MRQSWESLKRWKGTVWRKKNNAQARVDLGIKGHLPACATCGAEHN